jgi:hypothetical protein
MNLGENLAFWSKTVIISIFFNFFQFKINLKNTKLLKYNLPKITNEKGYITLIFVNLHIYVILSYF